MGIILHSFRDSFFSFSFLDGGGGDISCVF